MCIISPLEVFKVTTYLWLVPGFTVSNSVFVLFAIIGACWVLTWISLSLAIIERFFDMFLPPNLPPALVPFMIALEIIGFLARSLSLGVRLTANMLAGHTLLKLICMLNWGLYLKGGVLIWLDVFPWIILFALCGLEFGVACIRPGMKWSANLTVASSSIMKLNNCRILAEMIVRVHQIGIYGQHPWKYSHIQTQIDALKNSGNTIVEPCQYSHN